MEGNYEEKSDEAIVKLVQLGDSDLFGLLIERYEKKITRYSKKFLSDPEDLKDIVQQIFLKSYVNIKSFDTGRKFSSWIYRIAHNELINVLKKKNRAVLPLFNLDVFLPHWISEKNDINKDLENKETRILIEKSLDKLSAKYKEPMILYYIEDMGYKEVADIMQLPIATVGTRIKRAKKILKSILEEHGIT